MAGKKSSRGKRGSKKGGLAPGRLLLSSVIITGGLVAGVAAYTHYQGRLGALPGLGGRHGAHLAEAAVTPHVGHPSRHAARRHNDEDDARASGTDAADREDDTAPGERTADKTPARPAAAEASQLPDAPAPVAVQTDDAAPVVNITPVTPSAGDPTRPERPRPDAPPVRPQPAPAETHRPAAFSPMPPTEVDRGTGRRREVAITFDAGADYRPARQILDALAAEGVKTTFFLTGEWVRKNPKTARRIAEEGHEIGNHSWNHPAFTKLTDAAIRDQLDRTETIIQDTTGKSSRPYFRPPLGARDSRVLQAVGREGFLTIYWTLDSRDSVDAGITAEQIQERVLGKVSPGSIVLMHCGSQASADALPAILRGLKAKGLTPVSIGHLLAD
jgi:peptidoglycan/xylan/chitin deacetylase (PgdA/CDA1 family)